jgi:hypothetical protein
MREWVKALPLGLGLPVVIAAASVKPEDAASNISAWAHWLGVQSVPPWLSTPTADTRVIWGALGVSVVYAFLVWAVPAIRQARAPALGRPPLAVESRKDVGIWKSAPEAVEAFAEADLIASRDEWQKKLDDVLTIGHEAEDKLTALNKKLAKGILGIDDTKELNITRRKAEVAALQSNIAKDELRQAWDALRLDVEAKLLSGNLVARGFRVPHIAGSSEVEILPAEWRILTLQNVKSEAFSKTSGAMIYEGIVIWEKIAPAIVAPAPKTKAAARISANRTPKEIVSLFSGLTQLQGSTLVEPYKGLWITFESKADKIMPGSIMGTSSAYFLDADGVVIECNFGPDQFSRLMRVKKDDPLKMTGKIRYIMETKIQLEDCEVLN